LFPDAEKSFQISKSPSFAWKSKVWPLNSKERIFSVRQIANDQEETMAQEAQSFIEMLKKFGSDLGLPKVDVEKLIAAQGKNLDALSHSARTASAGAKSIAAKQKEIVEAALRDAAEMVREFKPSVSGCRTATRTEKSRSSRRGRESQSRRRRSPFLVPLFCPRDAVLKFRLWTPRSFCDATTLYR
jgi:hypothetical protein